MGKRRYKIKHLYLEILRIIACYFVIFNHTGGKGFFLFSQCPIGSLPFWMYMPFSIFCKMSVPLFFAISGALLLNQEESIRDIYTKRVYRILLVLLVYSFMYYMVEVFAGRQHFDLSIFLRRLWSANWNFSFWYLYAYIGFLISLPLIRRLANALEEEHYYYIMLLCLVFVCILPVVQYILWRGKYNLNENLRVKWILTNYIFYPLMGHFLHEKRGEILQKGKCIAILWAVNMITIMMSCILTYSRAVQTGILAEARSQQFHNTFVVINVLAVFMGVQYLTAKYQQRIPLKVKRKIVTVGASTFGIYLWHVLFLKKWHFLYEIWKGLVDGIGINRMMTAWFMCFLVMLLSYIVTRILKQIPYLNKLV